MKATGLCIDSSNFDPSTSDGDTAAGNIETDEVAALMGRTLDTSTSDENYASISNLDEFLPASGSGHRTSKGYQGTFMFDPKASQAICHSHPRGDGYAPIPGYADDDVIKQYGLPNYIVRNGTLGVLEKVDGQYQYRLILGSLSPILRQLTQRQLNAYQKP